MSSGGCLHLQSACIPGDSWTVGSHLSIETSLRMGLKWALKWSDLTSTSLLFFFTRFFSLFFTHHQTITVVKSFLKVKDLIMNINVRLNFSIKERWETNVCRLSVIVRKKENRNWTKSDSAGRASYFERNPESDAVICGCLGNVLRCGERMLHKKHISNLFGFVLFCLGVAEQASGGLDQHVPGGYALPC